MPAGQAPMTARRRKNIERKKLMEQVAVRDKQVAKVQRKAAIATGLCGARRNKNANGELCQQPAGWGTDHVGFGRCKHHGGSTPQHKTRRYKEQAVFMGAEKDINPLDAIMWCIRIKAGEIEWLSEQMQDLEKKDWYEDSIFGRQMHLFQRERTAAIELLAKMSKDAVSLGIAERAVRLAEQYGASIARLLKGIHDDLRLTNTQQAMWPQVVRRHLILIETTKDIGDPRQIEAPAPVIDGKVKR